jgi:transposase-like protein
VHPREVFGPNPECPARGQAGKGNSGIHSRQDRRFMCRQCSKTFTETNGTTCYRLRTSAETVTLVVTVIAHGCPFQTLQQYDRPWYSTV